MNSVFYEKAADEKNHLYYMEWASLARADYHFFGTHIHKSIEMVVCYDGEMEYTINGKSGRFGKNDVLLINSYDSHFYRYVGDASIFVFVFSLNLVSDALEDKEREFNNVIHMNDEQFASFLGIIRRTYPLLGDCNDLEKKSFALSLFGQLIRTGILYRPHQFDSQKSIASEIMEYISTHYQEDLSLDSVSRHFGYNRNYFSGLFNRIIGVNFTTYVNSFRMEKVLEMRKDPANSGRKAEDIIRSCGFSSSETYYRTYRNYLNAK